MGKHWHVCAIVSGRTGGGFKEAGLGGMLLRSRFRSMLEYRYILLEIGGKEGREKP